MFTVLIIINNYKSIFQLFFICSLFPIIDFGIKGEICLIWILGHNNIKWNEKADENSKKVAKLSDTPKLYITTYAGLKKQVNERIKIKWQTY